MPHLQFDINKKLNTKDKNKFCKYIRDNFGKIMKTGTDHVAISLRELGKSDLQKLNIEAKSDLKNFSLIKKTIF